jgi:adenosylcobinamide-GDP ribazoletransferase
MNETVSESEESNTNTDSTPNPTPNPSHWECFTTAIQFLTRIPVTGTMGKSAEYYYAALRKAVIYFPVVGGFVGLFTAIVLVGCIALGIPPLVAAFVALALEAALTGAFHEDAFADTWDALGGGWTREQVLEILKDSRLGTYGTLALVTGLGCRATAMAAVASAGTWQAIFAVMAAAALGRIAIVVMMASTAPIGDRASQAKDVSGTQTIKHVMIATALSTFFWLPWFVESFYLATASLLVSCVVFVWFRQKIMHRVGGTTGDFLGCTAFLIQLVFLIGASAR